MIVGFFNYFFKIAIIFCPVLTYTYHMGGMGLFLKQTSSLSYHLVIFCFVFVCVSHVLIHQIILAPSHTSARHEAVRAWLDSVSGGSAENQRNSFHSIPHTHFCTQGRACLEAGKDDISTYVEYTGCMSKLV